MISLFFALEPATTAVLIIGAIVLGGWGLWALFHTRYRAVIAPSGTSMPLYGNVTVSAQVQTASSAFANWVPAAGTIFVTVGSAAGILAPNVPSGGCTAAAPLSVTVTGTATGTDTVTFRGTNAAGDNAGSVRVTLTVTGG